MIFVNAQRLGAEAEGAGDEAVEDAADAGLSTCGKVARFSAALSLGSVSAPFCPQATKINNANTASTLEPTIRLKLNITEFYLP